MSPRVLVLEADPAIVDLYRDLFSDQGYEVTLLAQPVVDPHAIAALQADLILLELHVSGDVDCPEFIDKLKTHSATAAIPMVVCTSALHLLPPLEGMLAEYHVPVIRKPFQINQFLAVIHQAVASQLQHR